MSSRAARLPTSQEPHGIKLRRFAGSALYAEAFEHPIRVAHLTDLHVGLVTPMRVQEAAVAIANREEPDLVVLTGDFVCHSHAFLEDLTEVLRGFRVPTFAVLGNHDYWAGAPGVRKAIKRAGVELLTNQHTVITIHGQKLQIVGLDDAYTGHADREKALRGFDPTLPSLGLSHIAEEADGLWAHGVPFVLSGHTHGGQLTVARLNELTLGRLAGHRYIHGMYGKRAPTHPERHGAVYVGAGIGAAVVPIRVGDRGQREIAIFELGEAPGENHEHHAEQRPHGPGRDTPEHIARARAHERFMQRKRRRFRAPREG
jgi:predicted MPP superfamily phosphohydrolase